MGKIFDYNEIEKTAYMNWRTRHHQPIHDMTVIADGYMKAAIMLAEECLQNNEDKKADMGTGVRVTNWYKNYNQGVIIATGTNTDLCLESITETALVKVIGNIIKGIAIAVSTP